MKNREGKGPQSTDLLVCFPTRAHLTLMPKSICSPGRPFDSGNRHQNHPQNFQRHHSNHHSHLKKSIKRVGGGGYSSPSLWSKNKPTTSDISEPTSPKVTCAGQIKVSNKNSKCKNWQSVMEEIEKIHIKKQKKKHAWAETLGFKKEVMQFLTCLRSLRLDFRCFGSIPAADITSDEDDDDEDDEEEEEDDDNRGGDEDNEASRTVFSKWFMVLQEDQNKAVLKNQFEEKDDEQCAPPPNALLLMRCRSAPAKSWLEEKEEEEKEAEEEEEEEEYEEEEEEEGKEKYNNNVEQKRNLRFLMEEEKKKENEGILVMKCNTDFARFSTDIGNETWVVGGIKGSLSRSRSWKR